MSIRNAVCVSVSVCVPFWSNGVGCFQYLDGNIWPILMNIAADALNCIFTKVHACCCTRRIHTHGCVASTHYTVVRRIEMDGKNALTEIGIYFKKKKRKCYSFTCASNETLFNYFGWTFCVCLFHVDRAETI